MNKFAVFVLGPAGSGKSTFCKTMVETLLAKKKKVNLVNLDPAADFNEYASSFDIRTRWSLKNVMKETELGPNGGMLECLRRMIDEEEWLNDNLANYGEELLFVDCPGQIEIYLNSDYMLKIIEKFKKENYNVCTVYMMDSQFILDESKYFSGVLNSLCCLLRLGIPCLNVLGKIDLIDKDDVWKIESFLKPDTSCDVLEGWEDEPSLDDAFKRDVLDKAVKKIIRDFNFVQFSPLDISDESSRDNIMTLINNILLNDDLDLDKPDNEDY